MTVNREHTPHEERIMLLTHWILTHRVSIGSALDKISGCDYIPTVIVGDQVFQDDPRDYPTESLIAKVALALDAGQDVK